jgi:hypothetical protein
VALERWLISERGVLVFGVCTGVDVEDRKDSLFGSRKFSSRFLLPIAKCGIFVSLSKLANSVAPTTGSAFVH